ncbi:MAG: hypothetical protein ABWX96_21320 [Propionibacteriaceae bacterium]
MTAYETDGYDATIVACKVVDIDQWDARRRYMHDHLARTDPTLVKDITVPFKGSVTDQCEQCGVDIYIGPRALPTVLHSRINGLNVQVMCLVCASVSVIQADHVDVHSLNESQDQEP